jgi:hypothetical protein
MNWCDCADNGDQEEDFLHGTVSIDHCHHGNTAQFPASVASVRRFNAAKLSPSLPPTATGHSDTD